MAPIDTVQSLDNLKLERDAIVLYDALATIEKQPQRAQAFRTIAGNERRHAEIWATKLRELGADVPAPGPPRIRVRAIIWLARAFGTAAVSDLVQALEGDENRRTKVSWRPRSSPSPPMNESMPRPGSVSMAGCRRRQRSTRACSRRPTPSAARRSIGRDERWHRTGRSGTLRAIIFGVSDGLVSNTSLVMGVAGASGGESRLILLTGIAGLLAGAFSMAAGEYISMQSQRELYERQIALERAELEAMPAEEQAELATIYRAKGFTAAEAEVVAERLFRDPEHALDTLIREELGLDPDELGSPWGAAGRSFLAFAVGAAIPVLPFLILTGSSAVAVSLGLSLIAMFAVGVGVSLLTGRSAISQGSARSRSEPPPRR